MSSLAVVNVQNHMTAPRTMDLLQPAHLPTGSKREKNCIKNSFLLGNGVNERQGFQSQYILFGLNYRLQNYYYTAIKIGKEAILF